MEDTTIYRPLCMNIDVVRAINFPHVKTGDQLVIRRVLPLTTWPSGLQFITYRPNVVLIGWKEKLCIIRKRKNWNRCEV